MRLWRPCVPFAFHLQGPFIGASLTPEELKVQQGYKPSQSFSSMAVWGHCELLFFKENLKNDLGPVGKFVLFVGS